MEARRLERLCAMKLSELEIPNPFDINEFCAGLGRQHGRPIVLVPLALPGRAPCGIWAATDDTDYIFVQKQTSPLHQIFISLHEVAHLLFGHHKQSPMGEHTARLLAPTLDPRTIRHMLGRTQYTATEEREAEMLATMILNVAGAWSGPQPGGAIPPEVAELVRKLEATLMGGGRDRNV
jgi:hypothetical protein